MKTVSIFRCNSALTDESMSKLRESLKGQISEGLLVLDGRTRFEGLALMPEAAELDAAIGADEPFCGDGIQIVRRVAYSSFLEDIKTAIKSGRGREVIRPFDEFEIMLDTGEAVTVVCGGYVNETRARFVFKYCLKEPGQMNEDATNEGGYYKSKGRKHVLEDIYPHLPWALKEIIEPRPLVEIIDGEKIEYSDPLWLPSATDVFGPADNDSWWAEEPDSVQLEIFKRERDRVKEREGYGTTSYWLRSPYASASTGFVNVGTDGTVHYYAACYSRGFAPGFDL